jgi:hypothetical protein
VPADLPGVYQTAALVVQDRADAQSTVTQHTRGLQNERGLTRA